MKTTALFLFVLTFAITSCNTNEPKQTPPAPETKPVTEKKENPDAMKNANDIKNETVTTAPVMVGGDADAHGCKPSTGYQWSVLKKECIRAWELKLKFQNLKVASQGGWLLLSDDKKRAEFFGLPGGGSVLFDYKEGNDSFYESTDGKYYLDEQMPNHWELLKKGTLKDVLFRTIEK